MKINKKIKLFEEFDEALFSSDETLKNVLDKFNEQDYIKADILFDLIVNQKINLLKYLYDKGIPFTYTNCSGANVLHVASAISGSLKTVKFLIARNLCTDINAKTDENETPFLLAVMYDHKDIVKYFIKNFKPDLSIKTIYGDDALSLAKKTEDLEMVKIIENIK